MNLELRTINSCGNDILTIAFFVMSLLLATIWRNFFIVFIHKIREVMLSNEFRSFEVENVNSGTRLRLFLLIINLSSISIFLYQILSYIGETVLPIWQILTALVAIHLLRMVLTKIIVYAFELKGAYEIWYESYSWIHYILGVLIFPLAILMTYSPETTFSFCGNLAFVLFVLSELLLIYRLFSVFYRGFASLFYLFLYLCTLEILPLLTMFRIFIRT